VKWMMQTCDGPDPEQVLAELLRRPAWMDDAACRGAPSEVFFPTRGESSAPAKSLCAQCPVQSECLELALSVELTEDIGVWGNPNARERRALRAKRPPRSERPASCVTSGCSGPIYAGDRCLPCYKYRARHGVDRPSELIERSKLARAAELAS
ncbi:MAG: WhiB family transcriptional regulator, partial [Acidimicrobiales bacterium]